MPNVNDNPNLGKPPANSAEANRDTALADVAELPDEEFWDKFNRRLEFPLATVGAILVHVFFGAGIVFGIFGLMNGEDRSNPPLQLVNVGGMDDIGEGSQGSGGIADPDIISEADPIKLAQATLPTPLALAEAKENIQKIVLEDPTGRMPVSAANAAAYSQLDEAIRKKLLGVGAKKGSGPGGGSGFEGTDGNGPGGTGADSTRARGLRWVLRFRIADGTDYVAQLKAMGAEVFVPLPPDSKKCMIVSDLSAPNPRIASDNDMNRLAGKIQFSDNRPKLVREVLNVLKVDAPAKAFWAFFPKEVEEKLARAEVSYRNRRPENIEETIFRVTVRGGNYEMVVEDQTAKK
jgi:hypothetical protein